VLNSEASRIAKAEVINNFVDQILAADPNAAVVVLGDMNDFQFSPSLEALEGENGALINLIDRLPLAEQYTYIFDGNSQVLDHILVTSSLAGCARIDVVHTSAEFHPEDRHTDHDSPLGMIFVPAEGASPSCNQYLPLLQ
jgi:hypothetical protein